MRSNPPEEPSGPTLPAAPAQCILEPGRVVGRFRVLKLAGMGGMGEVYQAWDPLLERYVALKAVRPAHTADEENLERFRREALALAQLNHPHVCQVHDLVTAEQGTFIAMEWLDGETLDQAAKRLDRRHRLQLVLEVAEGLAAAHAKGLVHRDLKPSNVMVSSTGHAKILDFGLACQRGETPLPLGASPSGPDPAGNDPTGLAPVYQQAASNASRRSEPLTQQGLFIGSPRYASPEQIQGQPLGTATDVFSLGVMSWELLREEHPFPGEGRERFKAVVANRRKPSRFKGLHPALTALLEQMLAPSPGQRPTAEQVAQRLRRQARPLGAFSIAALAVAATLLAGASAYQLLKQGIVADLVKGRPASLVVLPVVNRTGDSSLQAELRWVVPDLVGAGLRASSRLRVVPGEALSGQQVPRDREPSTQELRALQDKLGADLCLVSELHRTPGQGWEISYRLVDRAGRLRFEGRNAEGSGSLASLQTLSRTAALRVLRAVDPFGQRPEGEAPIPERALRAYAAGKELTGRGSFGEAKAHFKQALEVAPGFSHAAVQYGICLQKSGDPACDLAIQWGRWAARAGGNRRSEIQAIVQLGLLRMEQGRWVESRSAFDEAMSLARALGDEDFQSAILNNLGYLALEQKRPQEAEPLLQQALAVHRRLGKRPEEMLTLNNLAVIAKERGDLGAAEATYQEVLAAARASGDQWAESLALNNLGDVALGGGAFARAEAFFRESLRIKRETGFRAGTVIPLANLGILARVQKQWEAGRASFREARTLAQELQKAPLEALVRFHEARLELEADQPEAALRLFRSAEELHLRLKDPEGAAQDLAGQAEALLAKRSPSPAVADLLRRAASQAQDNLFVLRARARELAARGARGEARRCAEQALAAARKAAPEEVPSLTELLDRI